MKIVFALLCCPLFALGASAPLGYPTATSIRIFKQNLDLNGAFTILSGTVDPTATATSANPSSYYHNTSTGVVYRKTDTGSTTNWVAVTTNSVVSSNTGTERAERATISSTCTISSQSGSWLTSSAAGAGSQCVGTFTTAYSATPTCVCSPFNSIDTCVIAAQSTTAVTTQIFNLSGANDSQARTVICLGAK